VNGTKRKGMHFHRPNGERAKANAGGPTVLVAYGFNNADVLRHCTLAGHFVQLRQPSIPYIALGRARKAVQP
jgi:hypothetical protein